MALTYVQLLPLELNRMVVSYLLPIYSADRQLIGQTSFSQNMFWSEFQLLVSKTAQYVVLIKGLAEGGQDLWTLILFVFGPSVQPKQIPGNLIHDLVRILSSFSVESILKFLITWGCLEEYTRINLQYPGHETRLMTELEMCHWRNIPTKHILQFGLSREIRITMQCALQHQSPELYRVACDQGAIPPSLKEMAQMHPLELLRECLGHQSRLSIHLLAKLVYWTKGRFLEDPLSESIEALIRSIDLSLRPRKTHLHLLMALVAWAEGRKYVSLKQAILAECRLKIAEYPESLHKLAVHLVLELSVSYQRMSVPLFFDVELMMELYAELFRRPVHRGSMYHLLSLSPPSIYSPLRPLVTQALHRGQLRATQWIVAHLL